MDHTPVHSVH